MLQFFSAIKIFILSEEKCIMKSCVVRKSGWNFEALLFGPFWYLLRGMKEKGLKLLLISIATVGLGIIPVWIYCGYNANREFYYFLKNKGAYIY